MNPPLCAYCPACHREGKENVAFLPFGSDSPLSVNGKPCCVDCLDQIVLLYHEDTMRGWPD
jgi:hypothetical protein